MKEIDVGPVDEEGTPDLYSAMMQELFRVRKLDTTFDEPRSMDWRVERTMLPIMVDKIHKQPSFIPRVGELVLWCRDLDGEIAYDPWMKEFKMHDPKTEKYTGYPQWMCGTVAQVPNEEVQIEDLVTETKKQNAINVSGFRVECLPDPNDYTKGYSKQYSYVPLHHIRPLNFWQEILHGIPEGDWHPSIFHGLSVMASMCVVKPFRFAGTWPSCNVFCKAMFVGAELFFVGDTVRLIPAQSQAKITDVLHIEKIFVKWANLEVNADGVVDESSASNLGLHLLGHAYTSDEKRSYKGMTLERDEDTGKYPLGMEGYDRWYYMQRPDSLHDYTYDRILGRCFEAEAMMLWSAKEEPTLDFGLQGTRAARLYSAENDQRLVTSEKKWFWGEHRADCLDLGTLNGIEIGSRDSDRDPKSWRDTLRVIDGETSQKEVEARTPKSTEGRSSKSTFTPINSQSSLVGSALQQVDDSDETSDEHHDSLKEELENEPFGNDDDMITDDEVIKQAKEASHIQGKGPDQSEEDEVAKSVTEEHGRNELGSPESNRNFPQRDHRSGAPPPPSSMSSASTSVDSGVENKYGTTPYDADQSEAVRGVADRDNAELWGEEAAAFIASAPGAHEPGWVGKRPLGEGGFGRAGLWELQDEEGNVRQRMVIKENMKGRKRGDWDRERPNEVYIMQCLRQITCPSIVKLLSYRRFPRYETHRIYLEYCPHGDLRKLYKRYKAWRHYIPEPFLWQVFYNLTQAAAAMYFGPGYRTSDKSWTDFEIVHRDIKPGNIFLGDETTPGSSTIRASHYPTAKIGDFGLAVITFPDDENNPLAFRGSGTRGYLAPEQESKHNVLNPPSWFAQGRDKLLWWTNVWAIGAVMYELTTLHRAARVLFNRPDPSGHGCPPISTGKSPEYSSHLLDLIRDCLVLDPSERPTLRQLDLVTRRHARMTRDALAYLRTAPNEPIEEERLYYRDNEINEMPPGDYIPSRIHERLRRESGFWNPDVSVLRYPDFRPFENSDDAADDDEEEQEEGQEEEPEGRFEQRFQFGQGDDDEDGEMDVDEPTVRQGALQSALTTAVRHT
ncbi:MAG: hypothetical protein M1830_003601, partial [Pleopsidium flavum]